MALQGSDVIARPFAKMKKAVLLLCPFFLMGCSSTTPNSPSPISEKEGEIIMRLAIDQKEVEVEWEENDSVKALALLSKETLSIAMHRYGGFEQTGPIGASIVSNDVEMDVVPGDIVLYNGNAISVFFQPSAWSYTKLGHIQESQEKLIELLDTESVRFVLKGETK